jgi:CBS domain-containing protein
MLIRDILNLKGGTIYRIDAAATLGVAVSLMVTHDVGSLVVMEGERMTGMLTFRELLRALEAHSGSLEGVLVREVMVGDPACGSPADTIDELRDLMTRHHVRYLPVKEGERLVGVVSFHDVAKAQIRETSMENRLLKRYIASNED